MSNAILASIVTRNDHHYNGEIRGGTIIVAGHSIPAQLIRRLEIIEGNAAGTVDLDDGTRLAIRTGLLFTNKKDFSGSIEMYVNSLSKTVTISARDIRILTRDTAERAG